MYVLAWRMLVEEPSQFVGFEVTWLHIDFLLETTYLHVALLQEEMKFKVFTSTFKYR